MKVHKSERRVEFKGEEAERLTVEYDNRGDPYREGITLTLSDEMTDTCVSVSLMGREGSELAALMRELYPLEGQ